MDNVEKFKVFTMAKGMIEWAKELNLGQAKFTSRAEESKEEAAKADAIAQGLKDMIKNMDENTRQMVFAALTILTEKSEEKITSGKGLGPDDAVKHMELKQASGLLQNYKFLIESQEKVANNNQNIESDRTM